MFNSEDEKRQTGRSEVEQVKAARAWTNHSGFLTPEAEIGGHSVYGHNKKIIMREIYADGSSCQELTSKELYAICMLWCIVLVVLV